MIKHVKKEELEVDRAIGRRLRDRRTLLGLSQSDLAKTVGVTFQQIQKYERGVNRISASRLYQFACLLEIGVDYFFDGIDEDGNQIDLMPGEADDPAMMRDVLALVRAYYEIQDVDVRRRMFELTKTLADEGRET